MQMFCCSVELLKGVAFCCGLFVLVEFIAVISVIAKWYLVIFNVDYFFISFLFFIIHCYDKR